MSESQSIHEHPRAVTVGVLASRDPRVRFDAQAASEQLGVPATWILAEARPERIPHVRLGKYVRFSADELDAWWRERIRGPWRDRGAASRTASDRRSRATTGERPVSTEARGQ